MEWTTDDGPTSWRIPVVSAVLTGLVIALAGVMAFSLVWLVIS